MNSRPLSPSPSPWSRVDWRALSGLRARFLDESAGISDYWSQESDLDSYDLTFGQRIAWKWMHVLDELALIGWEPPPIRVLDWGCGSGVAGRVFSERFAGTTFSTLSVWDRSSLAIRFAERRASERFPGLLVEAGIPPSEPFTLLLSHVLTELDEVQTEELVALSRRAEAVVCVEPGTYGASRRLIHFREALRGDFQVVAPCCHQAACPMLEKNNAPHWCHHFAWPPAEVFTDSDWAKFATFMGIDLRSLPVSFLVLDRRDNIQRLGGMTRLIGRARLYKPHALILGCEAQGLTEPRVSKRLHPELFKKLRKNETPPWVRWVHEDGQMKEIHEILESSILAMNLHPG